MSSINSSFIRLFAVPSVGKIQGRKSKFGAAIFEGIPFGAPPVGELRWMKTRPAEFLVNDWEYYNATFSRPACLQKCTLPSPDYVCPAEVSVTGAFNNKNDFETLTLFFHKRCKVYGN